MILHRDAMRAKAKAWVAAGAAVSLALVGGAVVLAPAAGGEEPVNLLVTPRSAANGVLGSFSALGTGMNAIVQAVAIDDDTLYAGGEFTTASGVAANNIAAWSVDTWSALGAGMDRGVYALVVDDDTLYAGGAFTAASGVTDTNYIAAWSDDTWHALGGGMVGISPPVFALAIAADDTLFAGGSFTTASGVPGTENIAAWSDGRWSALSTGLDAFVLALAVSDTRGLAYAGGYFTNRVRSWDWSNGAWSALGTGVAGAGAPGVFALAIASDDTVYAGGDFTAASALTVNNIAAWSGATWSALGTGLDARVRGIAVDDTRGLVYAGGSFTATSGSAANSLRRVGVWDSGIGEWIPFTYAAGNGVGAEVLSVAVDDSVVYLGGSFQDAGGDTAADRIARWTWEPPQGSNSLSALAGASVTVTGEGFIGVPATGGVKVGSTVATYTRDDSATITMTVPAGSFTNAPITVDGVGGWGEVGVLNTASPPAPGVPAGPPTDVAGVAGDASVQVRWAAPTSTGSFPITNYQVMSSPSGGMCLSTVLACEVTGLRNGTGYTFTVRALTGAGWGSWSQPSAVVTPQPVMDPSIMITGSRGEVRGRPGVVVTGTSTDFAMGAILRPWIRFPRQSTYTQGTARILVDDQGAFTWQRRTGRTIYISIRNEDSIVKSNRLVLRTIERPVTDR